jgi:chromosome segregation ATPase
VREYRQRKKEIGQLEKDLANRQQALDGHQEEIEKAKKDWLEPLQNLIEKINENFSYFFSCMSCAGEVDLNIPDNAVSIIYGKKGGKKANNENGNVNQFS